VAIGLVLFVAGVACDVGNTSIGGTDSSRATTVGRTVQPLVWGNPQTIVAPVPSLGGVFGNSVAVDGDTAVVGASFKVHAYRLRAGLWEHESEFHPEGVAVLFGGSVSISGGTLAVGAYCELPPYNVQRVCAHVYVRNGSGWILEQQLVVTKDEDPSISDAGFSVAVNGDTLFLGSTLHDAVFVFERSGSVWTERQVITAPDEGDAGAGVYLGTAIALGSDTAILGKATSNNAYLRGSAYAFVRSGSSWTLQQSLVGSGPASSTYGTGVALSGDTAAVSSWASPSRVHIFVRTGSSWTEEETISDSEVSGPVAVNGNTLAFRADASSVSAFERQGTTWAPLQTLAASGYALALSASSLLLGDEFKTVGSLRNAGNVLAFGLVEPDAGVDADADAEDAAGDTGLDADAEPEDAADVNVDQGHTDAFADAADGGSLDARADAPTASDGSSAGTGGGGEAGAPQPTGGTSGVAGSGGASLPPSRTSGVDANDGCGCRLRDARHGRWDHAGALLLLCFALLRRQRTPLRVRRRHVR
jgi:hypothetical protein